MKNLRIDMVVQIRKFDCHENHCHENDCHENDCHENHEKKLF